MQRFHEWRALVAAHLDPLSPAQVTVLALWSFGIVLARVCGLSKVAATLAAQLGGREGNLRQRLREWYWERQAKQGRQRQEWAVTPCFGPLLRWVLSLWPPGERRLALALDATSLRQVFVVLSLSVLYRGCALPVAWVVLPACRPGAWKPHLLDLLQGVRARLPADWQVLVMADRGLYAEWLYRAIQALGWHPFLRINLEGHYRLPAQARFQPLRQLLPAPGQVWAGRVICFARHSLDTTLLACWGEAYAQPWLILTDLPAEAGRAVWYRLRSWIEAGFKDLKRDGWHWQRSRMRDPQRAARLWLALALATLWVVSVGGQADAQLPDSHPEHLPPNHIARRTRQPTPPPRLLSCFTRGLTVILAELVAGEAVRLGRFLPEPWP